MSTTNQTRRAAPETVAADRNGARPTDEQLIADAVEAQREAEAVELGASPARWRQADAYAELRRRGYTQGLIGKECGTSQQSVSVLIRCSTRYPVKDQRPTFWDAYAEVTGEKLPAERQAQGGKFNAGGTVGWGIPPKLRKRAAKAVLRAVTLLDRALADDPSLRRSIRHDVVLAHEMLDKIRRELDG